LNRTAFTMIEVIFVIVIIGLLGAMAIPLLSTTSKEAEGTRIVHNLGVCINDAGSHYIKSGSFGGITQPGRNQSPSCRSADRCFNFVETDSNGSLKVSNDPSATSAECEEAHRIAGQNMLTVTHTLNF